MKKHKDKNDQRKVDRHVRLTKEKRERKDPRKYLKRL